MVPLRARCFARKRILPIILSFVAAGAALTSHAMRNENLPSVNILADNSLTLPLTKISRDFARTYGVMVSVTYSSAVEQLEAIEDGTAANLLITAQPGSINQLKAQGLANVYSQTVVARNRIALVARNDHPVKYQFTSDDSLSDTLKTHGKYFYFVAADPTFSELGAYSTQIISHYGLEYSLASHFVFPGDLPSIHTLIEEKPHAGLLYLSEVKRNPRLRVVDIVPEETHSPIAYEAIIVAGEHMEAAQQFMDYLKSPIAQLTLNQMGFEGTQ